MDFLNSNFVKTIKKTADYYAAQPGTVLKQMVPNSILYSLEKEIEKKIEIEEESTGRPSVLQRGENERNELYKEIINKHLSNRKSVFVCYPTKDDAERGYDILKSGIEDNTVLLHGSLKDKELAQKMKEIYKSREPLLIIGTPSFFCIPKKLSLIIIEKESSRFYKSQRRPFLDARVFATKLQEVSGIQLIFGDTFLRIETIWKARTGVYSELEPMYFRTPSSPLPKIIDMKVEEKSKDAQFTLLSDEVISSMKNVLERGGRSFLFSARRGLSPIVVCGDCGTTVFCNKCGNSVTLHSSQANAENAFLCHLCGERRDASERCKSCDSWNLKPLGIGSERIEDEILVLFPKASVFRIDKDSVQSEKQAQEVIQNFYHSRKSILIGTEMALNRMKGPVEFASIVSFDSLFSLVDFSARERIMEIILAMRDISSQELIIQTRSADQNILKWVSRETYFARRARRPALSPPARRASRCPSACRRRRARSRRRGRRCER